MKWFLLFSFIFFRPNKEEFIQAKHQQGAFIFRPSRDDTLCTESELGKQLHSSVRTANLDASLKLLIQGADPNYFHDVSEIHTVIPHVIRGIIVLNVTKLNNIISIHK